MRRESYHGHRDPDCDRDCDHGAPSQQEQEKSLATDHHSCDYDHGHHSHHEPQKLQGCWALAVLDTVAVTVAEGITVTVAVTMTVTPSTMVMAVTDHERENQGHHDHDHDREYHSLCEKKLLGCWTCGHLAGDVSGSQ